MHKLPRKHGFSLFELMIVLSIMGVLAAMVVPGMVRYQRKEETRSTAQFIAASMRSARQRAIREGTNYIVLFDPAVATNIAQLGEIYQDNNADFAFNPGDVIARRLFMDGDGALGTPGNPSSVVMPYGMGAGPGPFDNAPRHPSDPLPGNLGTVVNGIGWNFDAQLAGPAPGAFTDGFAFNSQGIPVLGPVPVGSAPVWGSGTGAYYVTDSNDSVFAVTVGPLGEVRVSAFNNALGVWN